jgi:hypothetical protein
VKTHAAQINFQFVTQRKQQINIETENLFAIAFYCLTDFYGILAGEFA